MDIHPDEVDIVIVIQIFGEKVTFLQSEAPIRFYLFTSKVAKSGKHAHDTTTQMHNNQNELLLPYPPAALPSLSMGKAAVPPPHSAAASYKSRTIGFGGTNDGSPVWGANKRGRWGLGLRWPPIKQETQQSTDSLQKRYGEC